MSKADRFKEEIGWWKVLTGVCVALDASLIGWLVQNYEPRSLAVALAACGGGHHRPDCRDGSARVSLPEESGGAMKDWVLIFCFANFCVMLLGVSLPLWFSWWDDLREGREKKEEQERGLRTG
jgi:hypothetical protein